MSEFVPRASWWFSLPILKGVLTRRGIRRLNEELIRKQEALMRRSLTLERAFDAVSDCVFILEGEAFGRTNRAAQLLIEESGIGPDELERFCRSGKPFHIAKRLFQVRSVKTVNAASRPARLIALRDIGYELKLEKEMLEARTRERTAVLDRIESGLADDLIRLANELQEIIPSNPSREKRLKEIVDLSERCLFECETAAGTSATNPRTSESYRKSLDELMEDFRRNFDFDCRLQWSGPPELRDESSWQELFLIVQESLRNAWRHAGATSAEIFVSADLIKILDNGNGLDETCLESGGIGLRSIRWRAEKLAFTAEIAPPPLNGWILSKS